MILVLSIDINTDNKLLINEEFAEAIEQIKCNLDLHGIPDVDEQFDLDPTRATEIKFYRSK